MSSQPYTDNPEQREEIVSLLRSGHTIQDLSDQYNISWNVLKDIINSGAVSSAGSPKGKKRYRLKPSRLSQMNEAVYQWYRLQRSMNLSVSSAELCIKALFFHSKIRVNNQFNASRGWLSRFRERHNITLDRTDGGESEIEAMRLFVNRISNTFLTDKDMTEGQVYSVDESVLLWNTPPVILPGQTISDSLTIITCTNMDGTHKLHLQTVGAYKEVERSDVGYTHLPEGYITKEYFRDWFHTTFVKEVEKSLEERGLSRCAVLILDNSSCHPSVSLLKDGDICGVMLPCQISNQIVPAALVATCLKLQYRKLFLKKWQAKAIITMKTACNMLNNSWRLLTEKKIQNCWSSFRVDVCVSDVLNIEEIDMQGLSTEQVMFWLTKDRRPAYVPFRIPTDTDIITEAQNMTRNLKSAVNNERYNMYVYSDSIDKMKHHIENSTNEVVDNMTVTADDEDGINVKRQRIESSIYLNPNPTTTDGHFTDPPLLTNLALIDKFFETLQKKMSCASKCYTGDNSVENFDQNVATSIESKTSPNYVWRPKLNNSFEQLIDEQNNETDSKTILFQTEDLLKPYQNPFKIQCIPLLNPIKANPNLNQMAILQDMVPSNQDMGTCGQDIRPVINIPSIYSNNIIGHSDSINSSTKPLATKQEAIAGLERFISYIDRQPSVTPILKEVIYEYKRFVETKL